MIIRFHAILVAAFVFTLVFACVAGAQEPRSRAMTAQPSGASAKPSLVWLALTWR